MINLNLESKFSAGRLFPTVGQRPAPRSSWGRTSACWNHSCAPNPAPHSLELSRHPKSGHVPNQILNDLNWKKSGDFGMCLALELRQACGASSANQHSQRLRWPLQPWSVSMALVVFEMWTIFARTICDLFALEDVSTNTPGVLLCFPFQMPPRRLHRQSSWRLPVPALRRPGLVETHPCRNGLATACP